MNFIPHAHSSIIHNNQEEATPVPLPGECMDRMWHTCTKEWCSVFKKKGILTHAAMWVNLEDIMLNEISQTYKVRPWKIPFV